MVSGSAILLLAMSSSIQHNCYFFSKHDMVTKSFISFQSSFYLLYLAQIQYDLCLINRADQINDFSFKSLFICLFVFAFLQNFSFILCLCLRWFVVQMWLSVIEEKTFVDSCEECGNILKWVQVLFWKVALFCLFCFTLHKLMAFQGFFNFLDNIVCMAHADLFLYSNNFVQCFV